MNETNNQYNDDDIDLIELLKKLYKKKIFIIKVSFFAVLIGAIYALFQSNVYTSSTTFIPQLNSKSKSGGSSLGGLASLAGINISGIQGSSEFPPSLYPQVVNGVPFKLELLSSIIKENERLMSFRDYLNEKKTSSIWNLFKYSSESKIENILNDLYVITKEDKYLFAEISKHLSLSINDKEGFITISYTDNDKNIAAKIVYIAQNLLQKKIIEFKNKSSKELLDFSLSQYEENKIKFEEIQDQRAIFIDKNINISSTLYQNKLNRIESELNISESIVQQLASQVEQAKLQVNKDTPVFTTIQPVTVPFQKSGPSRTSLVITFFSFGFLFSSAYVLLSEFILNTLKKINS